MGSEIKALLWALAVTCVVLVLAYWFTRHVVGRLMVGRSLRSRLTVLDQVSLGRDQRLVLARGGETVYLLGGTPVGSEMGIRDRISCLQVLSKEEAAPWLEQTQTPDLSKDRPNFWEAMRKVMEQKKR